MAKEKLSVKEAYEMVGLEYTFWDWISPLSVEFEDLSMTAGSASGSGASDSGAGMPTQMYGIWIIGLWLQ